LLVNGTRKESGRFKQSDSIQLRDAGKKSLKNEKRMTVDVD
jgi:hypothetical protein